MFPASRRPLCAGYTCRRGKHLVRVLTVWALVASLAGVVPVGALAEQGEIPAGAVPVPAEELRQFGENLFNNYEGQASQITGRPG